VAYRLDGKTYKDFPPSSCDFSRCVPVYETMKGWQEDLTAVKRWKDFPANAKKYLKRLETLLETPIKMVSVGSKRTQTVFL
ncbi:MAG TPA: adenylosuccinate synthetase, partial [Verrucomicrobiae bacterium]|nr:adenylosuccinate synthetase [Verrucomicrobiae bacterium]